jgi:hypothetical protein
MNSNFRSPRRPLFPLLAGISLGVAVTSQAQAPSLLERVQQRALERGAGEARLSERQGNLAAAAPESLDLTLAPRQCVVAAAAVDEGLPDVELSLRTPEGLSISDGSAGATAALRYCASASEEHVTVRVRSEKASAFALAVWNQRRAGERRAAAAKLTAPPPPSPRSLAERLAALAAKTTAPMRPMAPAREEELTPEQPRQRDVVLEAGHCYRILAVTEAPATNVDLELLDAKGAPLAREKASALEAVLWDKKTMCPATSGFYQLSLRIEGAKGAGVWQLFGAEDPDRDARWPVGGTGTTFVAKRVRELHAEHKGEAAAMEFQVGELRTAQEKEASFDVEAGRCYVAVAAGQPSLRALELELLDQRGNLVGRSEAQGSAVTAKACAELGARWTLRTRAFKGYGSFGAQVFRAPK